MELIKARQLREDRAKLIRQAQELPVDTAEQRTIANKMMDDADELKARIEVLERREALMDQGGRTAPPAGRPGADGDNRTPEQRYHDAFMNYLKLGMRARPDLQKPIIGMSAEDRSLVFGRSRIVEADDQRMIQDAIDGVEKRDMGSGGQGAYPGATTGFFVPVGFINRIEEALKYYGPMLSAGAGLPEIMDTATGQPLPFPTDNDTAVVGELIGEGVSVTGADASLGQIILGAYKFSSKLVKISIELLQDSAFDLESWLARKFANRLGRVLNTYMTTGTGTNQPKGIMVAAVAGPTALGSSSNDGTSAGANTIGSDDMIALEHSVDPLYRPGARYMFHDTVLQALRQVKDKYGRPLWMPGVINGAPDTINGYGYSINNDMDQLQTVAASPKVSKNTVVFGQLSKYVIRRVKDMSILRLEERFAEYGQIAFLGLARYDGNLLDAGTRPVKYLVNTF
jgi:HK97 family phage major capsid protein